jgi:hypothetical protein
VHHYNASLPSWPLLFRTTVFWNWYHFLRVLVAHLTPILLKATLAWHRFRLHHNNKIESTVNTQPLSFSTRPSTVNSQQSTVNNSGGVQPELIGFLSLA